MMIMMMMMVIIIMSYPEQNTSKEKLYSFYEATLIEARTSDKYSWGIKGFNKP